MYQHPIQGGVEILPVASCQGNRDKLRPVGPPGSYADFTMDQRHMQLLDWALQSCSWVEMSRQGWTWLSGCYKKLLQSGAIIGDGDRKRAPFLVLGLAPWYGTIFLFLEQIAPSPAAHTRTYCEDFLRMSRRGNGLWDSRNLCFWSTTQHVYVCWNLAQVFSS